MDIVSNIPKFAKKFMVIQSKEKNNRVKPKKQYRTVSYY